MRIYPLTQFILVIIAVSVLALLYFFYPASSNSFHPDCIFLKLTGLYCPGCGSQRAVSALLHGNFYQAINFNLLLVLSIPFILYSAFVFSWNVFSENKLSQHIFYNPLFIKIFLAAVILFAITRNIPRQPFTWLAP
jgi:hypothetical protein